MESIQFKNLRAFKDTEEIYLKQLNIAVGKNSCGKSSILRTFPLLKQTLEVRASEPILWYGRYVDFGDYKQSINKNSIDNKISFCFKFKPQSHDIEDNHNTALEITIKDNRLDEVNIKWGRFDIIIGYSIGNKIRKLSINNIEFNDNSTYAVRKIRQIIPSLYSREEGYNKYDQYKGIFFGNISSDKDELAKLISKIFSLEKDNKLDFLKLKLIEVYESRLPEQDEIEEIVNSIIEEDDDESFFSDKLSREQIEILKSYYKDDNLEIVPYLCNKLTEYNEELVVRALLRRLNSLVDNINEYFYSYYSNVKYIAPVRATAQRYYRVQGLDVEEVDSQGENIPMILKNMNKREKRGFEEWMKKKFGFFVTTNNSEGHTSIYINDTNMSINIADTGFGYSQILPIIMLLWKNKKDIREENMEFFSDTWQSDEKTIVIEQPELHLHPKLQVQLLDAIIEIINSTTQVSFFIETHSKIIIDYLGERISENRIMNEKVNLLLVEQNDGFVSKVRKVEYTKEGYLRRWPIGFFAGEEDLC